MIPVVWLGAWYKSWPIFIGAFALLNVCCFYIYLHIPLVVISAKSVQWHKRALYLLYCVGGLYVAYWLIYYTYLFVVMF
jgi:hypothetical protein